MKALILAAGFGTRLIPHTHKLPKPLFPLAGSIMLDRIVVQLAKAGFTAIMVNTHHLHEKIEDYIKQQSYPVAVHVRFEPQILGTGGAIKNIADFFQQESLLVINSDIVTDIDLSKVYRYHKSHIYPVTMVMHDHATFNCVSVNQKGFITEFGALAQPPQRPNEKTLAYTGIQIIDPKIVEQIPADEFSDIIKVYKNFLANKGKITACIVEKHSWHDIGSPTGFRNAALSQLIANRLDTTHFCGFFEEISLTGDGSDRKWSRLRFASNTAILADHGISGLKKHSEAASFIQIGKHLTAKKIAVPTILAADAFSGLVIVEDLGNENLQSKIIAIDNEKKKINFYCKVIDRLLLLSIKGREEFDPQWTFQTKRYDRKLILEKECRYFMEAFINNYLGMRTIYIDLQREFEILAEMTLQHAIWGLIHRDCQSRNIMWHKNQCY
ncbi:MAG: sugar phosphate nucleotidyltransferase, partial [Desulfobacteraceae bacterium]